MMSEVNYTKAFNFDQAWLNFELDLPLAPLGINQDNPFYVERDENPIPALVDALIAPYYNPPKFFLSGHRGSGRSTEALRLLSRSEIVEKYWPVYFSILDETDATDLDYRDVLFAIGSVLFRQFRSEGGNLPKGLLKELDSWRGMVEEEVTTIKGNRVTGVDVGAGLEAFFVNTGMRMRIEPKTRRVMRQVISANVNSLVSAINKIIEAISNANGKTPLVVIDDLDKTKMELSKAIFKDHADAMAQPACSIIYIISSSFFFSKEFDAIRDQAYFIPNVILTDPSGPEKYTTSGYTTMKQFVMARISAKLIEPGALMNAITVSGGVFFELARVMRTAIGKSRRRGASQIGEADVAWAVEEIRNEFRRILEEDDLTLLRKFDTDHSVQYHERVSPLMQLSALMEYKNGRNWFGVHPIVKGLLNE